MAEFTIRTYNNIARRGLERLPADRYRVGPGLDRPDAILLRSQKLHDEPIPDSVCAIGRAGSGTNNIPVEAMSQRGVPVFNAPGANANAVKELVLAGMLMAARNLVPALNFVAGLDPQAPDLAKQVEAGKKAYAGRELPGHTLGVVGLGAIGGLVADAALRLGMNVVGFDPNITVDAAWRLPAEIRKAGSLGELVRAADFVTLHVPLVDATRNLVNAEVLAMARPDCVLLNFARDAVVDEAAVLEALAAGRLGCYVCDFPGPASIGHPGVISLPHLGASTREAEENCAIMVADQVRDYLEDGIILHAVNFPDVTMPRESGWRLAVANANVPNMVGQISTAIAEAGLNIHNMVNKSRGNMAYTLVDVDSPVPEALMQRLAAIGGVLRIRHLPGRGA